MTGDVEQTELEDRKQSAGTGADNHHIGEDRFLAHEPLLRKIAGSLRAASELLFGDLHRQPVESIGDLDLAGQTAVLAHIEREIQHVLLHLVAGTDPLHPVWLDIDMTGRAGAGTAAIGIDSRHHVLDRRFHDGHAVLPIDLLSCPVLLDESQLCHSLRSNNDTPESGAVARYLGDSYVEHNPPSSRAVPIRAGQWPSRRPRDRG